MDFFRRDFQDGICISHVVYGKTYGICNGVCLITNGEGLIGYGPVVAAKQAIEIVTTQHRTMTRILDSGILDIMWLPFNGRRGVVLGMTHRNLAMDLENQTKKQRREKEEWFWA